MRRRSRAREDSLADRLLLAASMGGWEATLDGRQMLWSEAVASIVGRDRFDGTLADYLNYVHPADRQGVADLLDTSFAQSTGHRCEYRLVLDDGTERRVRQQVWLSADGAYLIGVIREVSTERALERAARQEDRLAAVATLAGGLSHDLNSLFTVILGSAERLEEWAGYGSLSDDAGRIVSSVQHAASLVAPLMAVAGCDALAATNVDCNEAVAAVLPLVEPLLDPGVGLVFHPSARSLPVWIDRVQLQQAVLDLTLVIAGRLSGPGEVHLRIQRSQDCSDSIDAAGSAVSEVVIDVSAVPLTLPMAALESVSRSGRLTSSALREVVETAGGQLHMPEGDGVSSMRCVFPSLRPPSSWEPGGTRTTASKARSILVAEDGVELRELLVQVLTDAGYQVAAAGDGLVAERLSNSLTDLDILLTDVVMPERGGYDLASKIAERSPGLVTVFMSGYIEDTGRDGWRPDPHWFLHKPFTIEQLLATVDQAVRYREQMDVAEPETDHISQ